MRKKWTDYLWILSALYIVLGFFNILFAWLGLLCFMIPLIISIAKGTKGYCNHYCGRGQLFDLLGNKLKLSLQRKIPRFFCSKAFRYGFLVFFLAMFANMIFATYLVFTQANTLTQAVTLFWTFKVPWQWAYGDFAMPHWIAQFAFGFYSLMLTSTLLGIIFMALFRPRSWCVICPMGTMTQLVCKLKHSEKG